MDRNSPGWLMRIINGRAGQGRRTRNRRTLFQKEVVSPLMAHLGLIYFINLFSMLCIVLFCSSPQTNYMLHCELCGALNDYIRAVLMRTGQEQESIN